MFLECVFVCLCVTCWHLLGHWQIVRHFISFHLSITFPCHGCQHATTTRKLDRHVHCEVLRTHMGVGRCVDQQLVVPKVLTVYRRLICERPESILHPSWSRRSCLAGLAWMCLRLFLKRRTLLCFCLPVLFPCMVILCHQSFRWWLRLPHWLQQPSNFNCTCGCSLGCVSSLHYCTLSPLPFLPLPSCYPSGRSPCRHRSSVVVLWTVVDLRWSWYHVVLHAML